MSFVRKYYQSVKDYFSDRGNVVHFLASTAIASAAAASIYYLMKRRANSSFVNSSKFWNERYAKNLESNSNHLLFGNNPRTWLVEQKARITTLAKQHVPRKLNVLEIGAGEGQNGIWVLKTLMELDEQIQASQTQGEALNENSHTVNAIDVSDVALKNASKLAVDQLGEKVAAISYKAVIADIMEEDLSAKQFDIILCLYIQFTPEHAKLHKKIAQLLRPGGLLILQGFRPKQLEYKTGGPPQASHLYTAEELREEFRDLQIIEIKEHDEEINDGIHKGISALVSMVATKSASAAL